jgi:hypothetical protein
MAIAQSCMALAPTSPTYWQLLDYSHLQGLSCATMASSIASSPSSISIHPGSSPATEFKSPSSSWAVWYVEHLTEAFASCFE